MRYHLSQTCVLKWLEEPSLYNIATDDLYELDAGAFEFLRECSCPAGGGGEECDDDFLRYVVSNGLVTSSAGAASRAPLKQSANPSLRYLELQITGRCNLRCKHCFLGVSGDAELPLATIERVLDDFEEMQGLRLLITGGEPLLHTRFGEINGLLPRYAFRKVLFTNGLMMSEELLGSLRVNEIQISLDGLEAAHDALRGRGTYRKTLHAIEMARAEGFDVSVSTMIHPRNLQDFEGMEGLMRRLGVKDWTVDVPCLEGNLRRHRSFSLDPEIAGKFLRYGFGEGLHGGGTGFACGLHLATVMADGKVARCSFYSSEPAGDIVEGLETCWRRIIPTTLNELKCDCDLKELCRGGCRYRALLLGDRLGKDLYRCAAYLHRQ